jgi:hypothetical protein
VSFHEFLLIKFTEFIGITNSKVCAQRPELGEGWEIEFLLLAWPLKTRLAEGQITEVRSEFLQLKGDILQPNFCQAFC